MMAEQICLFLDGLSWLDQQCYAKTDQQCNMAGKCTESAFSACNGKDHACTDIECQEYDKRKKRESAQIFLFFFHVISPLLKKQ